MTGFDLPENFNPNPERIGRVVRQRIIPPQYRLTLGESSSTSNSRSMAERTLRQYSAPSSTHIPMGLNNDRGTEGFELKTGLVNMVQASPFCGKATEDANAHLQNFLEVSSTINPKGTTMDNVRLRLFPFSLLGKAKTWFYTNKADFTSWDACSNAFLVKYFPVGKTNALRNRISSFQQLPDETIPEAWERLQDYIAACPHHGMEEWLIIQNFFHGLDPRAQDHIDAAAGGAFLSLAVPQAKTLIDKIASNQSWKGDRQPTRPKGVHQVEGVDMLAAKMDLLMKKLESPSQDLNQIMDSRMTCETCGETGHSGNHCPGMQEDVNFGGNNFSNNSGYRPQQQGWNSKPNLPFGQQQGNIFNNSFAPSLKDLVYGQKEINDNISKKFQANDKILESLASQLEGINSVIKNQMSFNKMIETQVAQLASSCPDPNSGKLPGKPEVNPKEKVNAVTTRAGKSTRDPPYPQGATTQRDAARETKAEDDQEETQGDTPATLGEAEEAPRAPREYYDTTALPFPERRKKPVVDEQFGKFVEVIRKLYVNIPFLDAMQVPTYAKYIKDILGNKKDLTTTEVVRLTEECSVELADQSVRYLAGIAENIPVKIRNFFVPVDFVVLDMEVDTKTPLILGRPFLSTANAHIDVGAGVIQLNINGQKETFTFRPKEENCSQVTQIRLKENSEKQLGKSLVFPEKLPKN